MKIFRPVGRFFRFMIGVRHPFMTAALSLAFVALMVGMVGCPAFRSPGPEDAGANLAANPLEAAALPGKLRRVLPKEERQRMSDTEGFAYGFSGTLSSARWSGSRLAEDLNRGIAFAEEGRLPLALKILQRHHSYYPRSLSRSSAQSEDGMPEASRALTAYGLIRYNRAIVLLRMAASLRKQDPKRTQFLRLALYDLRRSCGAFERLGNLESAREEPYWGRDVMAWDGVSLMPEDSGLAIHYVYANLALAYLRLGNEPGYPEIQVRYMNREFQKYTTGQTELGAVTSLLTQSCIADSDLTYTKYRLTMALQNLEAAGRGMQSGGEVRFNYTIGLILAGLYRMDEGVVPEHAAGFLELAAQGINHPTESRAAMAAKRELALLYLDLGRDERFLAGTANLVPAQVRASQDPVQAAKPLQFADIALYGHLRRGEWAIAANHLRFREDELAGRLASKELIANHRAMVEAVCEGTMLALRKRLRQQWEDGEGQQVTGYLLGLRKDASLQGDGPLARAFQKHTWNGLRLYPGIRMSLWLADKPFMRNVFIVLPWILLVGFACYIYWVWASHRKWASMRLQSGYVQDIHGT